jgi:hypothetical protein
MFLIRWLFSCLGRPANSAFNDEDAWFERQAQV